MKELILSLPGCEIPVLVTGDKPLQYDRATILNWLTSPTDWNCDKDDVAATVAEFAEDDSQYFTTSQLRSILYNLLDEDLFDAVRAWFRGGVNPAARRLAKKAPVGSRIIRLNGLLVRQHQEYPWLYNLKDAHKSARQYFKSEASHKAKEPTEWYGRTSRPTKAVQSLIAALESKPADSPVYPIWHSERGNTPQRGVWVCRELLYAYTEWLHPKLHLQILQVFGEYESGDLVRKPKVTSNGVVQDEQWHEHREASKVEFAAFDNTCRRYVLSTPHMMNRMYEGMYGTNADGVKRLFQVPRGPLRDHLSVDELGKHTMGMELIRRGIAQGKVSKENKQGAYLHAAAAGRFVQDAFNTFDRMTPEDMQELLLSPRS